MCNTDLPAMEHIAGRDSRQLLDNLDIVVAWSQAVSYGCLPTSTVVGPGMRLTLRYCPSFFPVIGEQDLCVLEWRAVVC